MKEKSTTKKFNLYTLLVSIASLGVFITVGLLVLMIMGVINLSVALVTAVSIIAVICGGLIMALPWIRRLTRNENKITSYIFAIFDAIIVVMWIVAIVFIVKMVTSSMAGDALNTATYITYLQYIQANLIITFQFITASFIVSSVLRYRSAFLVLQIFAYLSSVFVDLYVSAFFASVRLSSEGLALNTGITQILGNIGVLTTFIMMLVYVAISYAIMNRIESKQARRRIVPTDTGFVEDEYENIETTKGKMVVKNVTEETPENKLLKLKDLLDKNIITQEEYDKKRSEIIDQI